MNVLLLVNDNEICDAYTKEISMLGASCDAVSSIVDLETAIRNKLYNGILFDIVTKARTGTPDEKARVNHLMEMYPTARLKWNPKNDSVNTLLSVSYDGDRPLDYFINDQCKSFTPRLMRTYQRSMIHFNLTIGIPGSRAKEPDARAVTVDISKGGCYINSLKDYSDVSEVWLVFKELSDKTPIVSEVCWHIPWGKSMKLPGFGVNFTQISDAQKAELEEWLG